MSKTSDKNKNYKEQSTSYKQYGYDMTKITYYSSSSNSNTAIGYGAMYANTTGSTNVAVGTDALDCGGMTEEKAIEHMKSLNIDVKLRDDINATVTMYEYVTIKNLVNNDNKELIDLTNDELDVYLITVRL